MTGSFRAQRPTMKLNRHMLNEQATGAATDHLSRALALYQRLKVPEATEVTEALASLRTNQVP